MVESECWTLNKRGDHARHKYGGTYRNINKIRYVDGREKDVEGKFKSLTRAE